MIWALSTWTSALGIHLKSQPIKIVVGTGTDKEEVFVHKHLLQGSSAFFQKALQSTWKEGAEGSIALPDQDIKVVEAYCLWLYNGRLFIDNSKNYDILWDVLCQAYTFADFIQDSDFQNATLDALCGQIMDDDHFPLALAALIYLHSTKGSKHRKLVVELAATTYTKKSDRKDLQESNDSVPQEFLVDLLFYTGPEWLSEPLSTMSGVVVFSYPCQFHDHLPSPDDLCYRERFGI